MQKFFLKHYYESVSERLGFKHTNSFHIMKWKKNSLCLLLFMASIFILPACFSGLSEKKTRSIEKMVSEDNDMHIPVQDYTPIPFPKLIGVSDLIVLGSVKSVEGDIFKFEVDEFLLNGQTSTSILVTKYIPPQLLLESRIVPYVQKQRFALFLKKTDFENPSQPWNILGYAGEGEMPIENGFVYFEGSNLHGLEQETFKVQGASRSIQRFNLTDFKNAVKNYRDCFSWDLVKYTKNNKKRQRWIPSRTCSDSAMKDYQTRSWIHNYLVVETNTKIPEKSDE